VDGGIGARLRGRYQQTANFFGHRIWEERLEDLGARRAQLYRAARILDCTLRGLLVGDTMHVRAAALTYFTVLSLVPLLAFAFALLKGFGAYEILIRDTVRPNVLGLLKGNEALTNAFEQIIGFVEKTGVTSLGFLGLLGLLYAATRLLYNIEGALNEIWGVKSGRELLQQMRDYVLIILVTPLCLMAAAALGTAGQAVTVLKDAGDTLGITGLVEQLVSIFGPLVALFVGFLLLYKLMPFTNVRWLSAVLGAAIGAVLWYIVLIVHVRFQIGVARFNALYSSFGAIPIFLAWLHVSWLVVLVGAQVAATHQNNRSLAQRTRIASADQATKEAVCLAAVLRIASTFVACEPPKTLPQLSAELDVPESLICDLLDRLVSKGMIVRAVREGTTAFALGFPPERIHLKDVLDALRQNDQLANTPHALRTQAEHIAGELWRALDRAAEEAPANRSLRDVLETRS
jgi:membrane protein